MSGIMSQELVRNLEKDLKISFIATQDGNGYPHITFISSLQAKSGRELIWGQNSWGESKRNILINPKTGILVMNLNLEMWRGKALWKHSQSTGPEMDMYNKRPVNRYNAYGGITKVHYMDLVEIGEKEKLNMGSIILGALRTRAAAAGAKRKNIKGRILRPYGEKLIRQLQSLKFIAYIENSGFPVIIPVIQASAPDSGRVVFSISPYQNELKQIPAGAKTAIFTVSMSFDEVMVKGEFKGFHRINLIRTGIVDIEKVYNPIPPKTGYIYPEPELKAVTEF